MITDGFWFKDLQNIPIKVFQFRCSAYCENITLGILSHNNTVSVFHKVIEVTEYENVYGETFQNRV